MPIHPHARLPFIGLIMALLALIAGVAQSAPSFSTSAQTDESVAIAHEGLHLFSAPSLQLVWSRLVRTKVHPPIVTAERIVVGSSRGVFAFATADGTPLWQHSFGSEAFRPVLSDDILYSANLNGALAALRADNGQVLWQTRLPGWIYPPVLFDSYLVTGGSHGMIWGIDRLSGETLWKYSLGGSELVYAPIRLVQQIGQDQLLLTTFAAQGLHLRISRNGIVSRRHFDTGVAAFFEVVATGNHTASPNQWYLAGMDGSLQAFSTQNFAPRWRNNLGGRPPFEPTLHNNQLIVVNDEGRVHQLDPATGRTLRRQHLNMSILGPALRIGQRLALASARRNGPPSLEYLDTDI